MKVQDKSAQFSFQISEFVGNLYRLVIYDSYTGLQECHDDITKAQVLEILGNHLKEQTK